MLFDLDETLVHCNEDLSLEADAFLDIVFPNNETITAGVNVRPYTKEILSDLA